MTWSVRAGSPPARAADAAGTSPRTSSSSATSGASVGSARATAASPACHSRPCGPCHGRAHTTWPRAMYVARRVPSCSPGRDDAHREPAQVLDPSQLAHDLLERLDPVAQPRGVLEPKVAREPLELCLQLRQRVVDGVPFDALQRPRRELRATPALERAERPAASTSRRRCRRAGGGRRSGRDARSARSPAAAARGSAAAPRARPRTRSRARATRSGAARRARSRPRAVACPSGSTSAAARAGRVRGRRRAPGRARRGRGRRRAAAARRTRGCACGARAAAASPRARRGRRPSARRAPAPCPIRQSRISAVASASGSARWHGRASVAKRYESAARLAGWRPSSFRARPTVSTTVAATRLPVSRIVSLSRNAMSKRALCATRIESPAKSRKRRTTAATGGARRRSSSRRPVSAATPGCRRAAGIRERSEPLLELERAHAHRADLARPRRARPQAGRLEVEDDERRLLEQQLLARRAPRARRGRRPSAAARRPRPPLRAASARARPAPPPRASGPSAPPRRPPPARGAPRRARRAGRRHRGGAASARR